MSKHKKEGINFKNIACIILMYLPLLFFCRWYFFTV